LEKGSDGGVARNEAFSANIGKQSDVGRDFRHDWLQAIGAGHHRAGVGVVERCTHAICGGAGGKAEKGCAKGRTVT